MDQELKQIDRPFWDKVDIKGPDDCWLWIRGLDSAGYGQCYFYGRYKSTGAHRVAWELTNGPIPFDKSILHKCDNRKCCNPNHLYVGTQADNMRDRAERYLGCLGPGGPSCFFGGRPAKLSRADIENIRSIRDTTNRSQSSIALEFNVSQMSISRILNSNACPCKEGCYI